jgi:predicted permease
MPALRRFFNFWRGRSLDREFDDELRFHLEMRIEANLLAGMTREDAEAEARRHLGSSLRVKEDMRDARVSQWLDSIACDLRDAMRSLSRHPGITSLAVLMLSLGIGATTAMFSVVYSVLIKPLPYPDSDALVRIVHKIGGTDMEDFNDAIFVSYGENNRTFLDLGVWNPYAATATITGQGDPEEASTLTASRGFLTTIGVQPEIGRIFSADDDTPRAPNAVILTNGYWQRKFGGDRGVLGRTLTINGRPHQIVGVVPAEFRFGAQHDLILPQRIDRGRMLPFFYLHGVARLKPGVTLAQANADAARILRIWLDNSGQKDPAFQARYAPSLRFLKQDVVGDVSSTLWVSMGTIGLVLLMACANVANLLLVRADARGQEFAIRAALGARWIRVARALMIESLTLAALGGILGLGLAYIGLRVLVAIGPSNLPRLSEISIDPIVLPFVLVVSLLSALLYGIIPTLKCAGWRSAPAMGGGWRGASLTRERHRSQNTLVTIEIALALVLLVSAGLMIRSFQALRRVDPGFTRPQHLQTFSLSIPPAAIADPERMTRIQHDILEKLAALPGVVSTAFTTRLPMDPSDRWSAALSYDGIADDGRTPPNRQVKVISPGTFQTFGTPLVAGRDFTWPDLYEKRDVAIISENLAREMWGSPAAALGKRIRQYYGQKGPWREIVGVAADVHDDGAHQQPPPTVYWPAGANPALAGYQPRKVSVAIRTERTGSESLLSQMREAVWSVNSNLPLAQVRTLDKLYDQSMAQTSFTLVVLAIAGAMALLLGVFGVYGVISYAVSQRRREIGIRVALGAQARGIQRLFLRRALTLAIIGIAIGLVAAAGMTQLMRSLLFGVGPLDPVTFAAVPVVLAVAAVIASYLPARRAMRVDPVETLKTE